MTNTQNEAERYVFFNMTGMARSMQKVLMSIGRFDLRIGPWISYYCCQVIP